MNRRCQPLRRDRAASVKSIPRLRTGARSVLGLLRVAPTSLAPSLAEATAGCIAAPALKRCADGGVRIADWCFREASHKPVRALPLPPTSRIEQPKFEIFVANTPKPMRTRPTSFHPKILIVFGMRFAIRRRNLIGCDRLEQHRTRGKSRSAVGCHTGCLVLRENECVVTQPATSCCDRQRQDPPVHPSTASTLINSRCVGLSSSRRSCLFGPLAVTTAHEAVQEPIPPPFTTRRQCLWPQKVRNACARCP